jgi:hypothetical protein
MGDLITQERTNPDSDRNIAEDIKNRLLQQAADEPDA